MLNAELERFLVVGYCYKVKRFKNEGPRDYVL